MEFWENFVDTFDLTGYKVYIVGESYAGMYVPYIAGGMLDTNNTDYFNVSSPFSSAPSGQTTVLVCPRAAATHIVLCPSLANIASQVSGIMVYDPCIAYDCKYSQANGIITFRVHELHGLIPHPTPILY